MDNIKQFKLTSGEEILCEVIEWPEEGECDIIVRKILQITTLDDDIRGLRMCSLKPWMSMQEDDDCFQIINSNNIAAEANPTLTLLEYFNNAHANTEEDVADKLNNAIKQAKKKVDQILQDRDQVGDDNIIQFDKNKLH
jgi:hypothetical protein